MKSDYKDILITKYEDFRSEENLHRKKLLRFEVLNILRELDSPDSNDLYIWGLTYYNSEDDREYNLGLGLQKFLEAYELDSQNFMPCLYIAHSYQDIGELKNALKYYELVEKEQLKEFQTWRYVKLIEQSGFCNYKLGNKELGRKQFQEVLDLYRKLPIEDLVDPVEMTHCLHETDEIIIEINKLLNN